MMICAALNSIDAFPSLGDLLIEMTQHKASSTASYGSAYVVMGLLLPLDIHEGSVQTFKADPEAWSELLDIDSYGLLVQRIKLKGWGCNKEVQLVNTRNVTLGNGELCLEAVHSGKGRYKWIAVRDSAALQTFIGKEPVRKLSLGARNHPLFKSHFTDGGIFAQEGEDVYLAAWMDILCKAEFRKSREQTEQYLMSMITTGLLSLSGALEKPWQGAVAPGKATASSIQSEFLREGTMLLDCGTISPAFFGVPKTCTIGIDIAAVLKKLGGDVSILTKFAPDVSKPKPDRKELEGGGGGTGRRRKQAGGGKPKESPVKADAPLPKRTRLRNPVTLFGSEETTAAGEPAVAAGAPAAAAGAPAAAAGAPAAAAGAPAAKRDAKKKEKKEKPPPAANRRGRETAGASPAPADATPAPGERTRTKPGPRQPKEREGNIITGEEEIQLQLSELNLSKLTPLARAQLISQLQPDAEVLAFKQLAMHMSNVNDALSTISTKVDSMHSSSENAGSSSSVSGLFNKIINDLAESALPVEPVALVSVLSALSAMLHHATLQAQARQGRYGVEVTCGAQ